MFRPPAAGAIGADDVTSKPEVPLDRVRHGFIARGNPTLLTGQGEARETTLLSALPGLRGAGGPGRSGRPGRRARHRGRPRGAETIAGSGMAQGFSMAVCF